jgi:DNA-binding MarR family transcriptional regulator
MGFKEKDAAEPDHVSQVHEFNWFYAKQIESLQEPLRRSPHSWTELRILYQLLHGNVGTASELGELLAIDRGYLSRILKRFESLNLIDRKRSPADGRELLLRLTSKGRRVCVPLDKQASANVKRLLESLSLDEIRQLVGAMDTIRRLFCERKCGQNVRKQICERGAVSTSIAGLAPGRAH